MPIQEDIETVSRLRRALPEVCNFAKGLLTETAVDYQQHTLTQRTVRGLLDRLVCWLDTLHTLNNTNHFQGYASGLRAIIELTVDIAALQKDPTLNDKLEAWELSAKFKHAKGVADFAERGGDVSQVTLELAQKFVLDQQPEVLRLRQHYWGDRRHPNRWTGRDLCTDTRAVSVDHPGLGLESVYEGVYRYLCFLTHGSGLAGTRGATGDTMIPFLGIALIKSAELSFGAIELAMRALGRFDLTQQVRLRDANQNWILRYAGIDAELFRAVGR